MQQKFVLVLKTKYEDLIFDASNPIAEELSYKKIFKYNEDFSCYTDIQDKHQKELYKKAKKGDVAAIKELLELRADYEYEYVSLKELL